MARPWCGKQDRRIHLAMQGTWVRSLVGELKSDVTSGLLSRSSATTEPAHSGVHRPQPERLPVATTAARTPQLENPRTTMAT